MSSTELFLVKADDILFIGECKNSWRSGMYVWEDIAKRYFKVAGFMSYSDELQRKIWNAQHYYALSEAETIVLLSTMDNILVKYADAEKLITAFREYGAQHPNSSFTEQADIIQRSIDNGSFTEEYCLVWNQISVGDLWCDTEANDDDPEAIRVDLQDACDLFVFLAQDTARIKE